MSISALLRLPLLRRKAKRSFADMICGWTKDFGAPASAVGQFAKNKLPPGPDPANDSGFKDNFEDRDCFPTPTPSLPPPDFLDQVVPDHPGPLPFPILQRGPNSSVHSLHEYQAAHVTYRSARQGSERAAGWPLAFAVAGNVMPTALAGTETREQLLSKVKKAHLTVLKLEEFLGTAIQNSATLEAIMGQLQQEHWSADAPPFEIAVLASISACIVDLEAASHTASLVGSENMGQLSSAFEAARTSIKNLMEQLEKAIQRSVILENIVAQLQQDKKAALAEREYHRNLAAAALENGIVVAEGAEASASD